MLSTFRRTDALLLLLAALVVALYVASAGGGFPLDDSWIHQTYGRSLGLTREWAFVPGVPSAASTSPLYTVLLAIGYKLGIPFQLWTHSLGALALALAAVLASRMAERLAPKQKRIGLIAGLALLLVWQLDWAAASGMETMLFSMLTLLLIWLAWRETDSTTTTRRALVWHGAVFGALAAVTTLTRPEGVALAGIIGLVMLAARPQGSWGRVLMWSVGAVVGFAIVISPYLIYNFRITGGLLPDTAAAKQAEYAPLLAMPYLSRLASLLAELAKGMQVLLVPGAVYFAVSTVRRLSNESAALLHLLPLIWPVALVALYAARLPATYQHGRYVIPTLPAFVVAGVVGMAWWLGERRASLPMRVVGRALALSAALTGLLFALVVGLQAYRTDVQVIDEEMVAAAQWIAANVPPDDLLAVHDIGAVGYFAPRPILDLAGLVSPDVVPIIANPDALWSLMQARGVRYLMAFPDQIPGGNVNDSRLCLLYTTGGAATSLVGHANMAVYGVAWARNCP
jgi:hypothetical protein